MVEMRGPAGDAGSATPPTAPLAASTKVRGRRVVLAVAEKHGIASDLHRREIVDAPVDRPIDPDAPAAWTPADGLEFTVTRSAYDFIARLKKHAERVGGLRITIQSDGSQTGDAQTWGELSLSDDIELTGASAIIEALRPLAGGDVAIGAKRVRYETGQRFLEI